MIFDRLRLTLSQECKSVQWRLLATDKASKSLEYAWSHKLRPHYVCIPHKYVWSMCITQTSEIKSNQSPTYALITFTLHRRNETSPSESLSLLPRAKWIDFRLMNTERRIHVRITMCEKWKSHNYIDVHMTHTSTSRGILVSVYTSLNVDTIIVHFSS